MKLKGKKILVTGGAGFIGSHLVDSLIREGCAVSVIDNLSNGKPENINHHKNNSKFKFIFGSLTNRALLSEAMKNAEIVFHLACLGVRHSIKHPFENHRVNSEGTLLVLQEAHRTRVRRFLYCSSSEVYGTGEYVPMPESHPAHPNTVYGASKLAGEAYARAFYKTYGLKTVIIRPFNAFGPRSHHEADAGEMIPRSIVRVLNNKPILIFGDGSQTRDYTYVEDVVKGLIEAAQCDDAIGRTLNMGSNFEISVKEIAEMICKMMGVKLPKIKYLKKRPGDVLRLYSDSSLIKKIINWQPKVSFKKGLLKTIQWFESRPEPLQVLFSQQKSLNWQ